MIKHIAVAALITDGDKIFIAQRPEGKALAGYWEFPGGKVEANETKEDALKREIIEELDCEIEILAFIQDNDFDYADFKVNISFFFCKALTPIHVLEHQDSKWIDIKDLKNENILPSAKEVIERIS